MTNDEQQKIPPGWEHNPSQWDQRIPLVVIAFLGFLIAMYLGLYQMDVFTAIWDPFFDEGSETILNSSVSRILPIPDATLGAVGYLADVVTGVIGGTGRWRKKPWIVVVFGFAVGPLGMISVTLIILQPVLFNAWCTLCICSAIISVIMISPAMDEMLASLQYLQRVKQQGGSLWKAFWGSTTIQKTFDQ